MRLSTSALLSLLVLLSLTAARAADAPPAEAFGTIPQTSMVTLSPDGTLLAWHDTSEATSRVVVFDIAARAFKFAVPVSKGLKLRSLAWSDNETVLAEVGKFEDSGTRRAIDHYEMLRTIAIDVVSHNARMLLMEGARASVTSADILAYRAVKPKTVIMSTLDYSAVAARGEIGTRLAGHRGDSGWVEGVFEVDTRSGKGTMIEQGTPFTIDWVVDRDGHIVARSEWNPDTELFTILARRGGNWTEVLREQHLGTRVMYGLASDGRTLIVSGLSDAGRRILAGIGLEGGAVTTVLADENADVIAVDYDRLTRAPVSALLGGMDPQVRWLDKDAERRFQSVAKAFPGKRIYVYSRSEDGQRVLAEVEGPSNPPVYYLVDFRTGKADLVGEAYPGLANVKLGEVRATSYKARDGASVPAYLTLPPGSDGKNLSLVVLPHGGPESRDDFGFDWWAQFLAVRGYAVLQPQFRGSTGFGEAWRTAGYRQWGKLMQDDVSDGVKALVADGVADPKRVCIVGASYGGYVALAGATFTPDLYSCAVSVNGISDLPQLISYAAGHSGVESNTAAYWRDHIGSPLDPLVIAKSPVRSAMDVGAPVLLMHATDDTVVPYAQSESMARAMKKFNKPVTLVKLTGEDHWLSQSATRTQVLKEIDKFLAANLRATP
jgi:dipeptidyl aminopeptidase/acylaminoacyl peptidase